MLDKVLFEVGLSKSDAKVYNALVTLRQATPSKIAERAKVPRVNTYYALKKMARMGLVSMVPTSKQQEYIPADPERLRAILTKRQHTIESTKGMLDEFIAEMRSRPTGSEVKYFEGEEGIKQAYVEFLGQEQDDTLYAMVSLTWPLTLSEFFAEKRVQRNIWARVILEEGERTLALLSSNTAELREIKVIPPESFAAGTYIAIYRDAVMLVNEFVGADEIGIVIRHKAIATAIKAMFIMLWERLE